MWKNTNRSTNKHKSSIWQGSQGGEVGKHKYKHIKIQIQIYANTNTDLTFDKMGQESEEGEVGKARSCLLANTRITVGYTEKI